MSMVLILLCSSTVTVRDSQACGKMHATRERISRILELREKLLSFLYEKYLRHQQDLYHVFTDFKKAFDRVWYAALWATMKKYNISANIIPIHLITV